MSAAKALFLSGQITGLLLQASPKDFEAAAGLPELRHEYRDIVSRLAEIRELLPENITDTAIEVSW